MAKRLVRMLPMAILALAAPVDMALPSQPLGNLTWTGPIDSPTGLKRSFQGRDFASIERQIKDINPLFTWESIAPAAVIPSPPRTRYSVGFACNANGELEALRQLIEVGIDYLHGKPWDCGISPGTCTRVSCSYHSAIFLCAGTAKNHVTVPCTQLGDWASDIIYHEGCSENNLHHGDLGGTWHSRGKDFDSDGWYVEVGFSAC